MQNTTRHEYRPDIDGLRAVAVLIVIAFHAFPSWMPGGFIGVDVFFVISGYLITLLIRQGLDQKNFAYWAFYASRAKRLFPSLIFVLVACQVFGWFALLADEYKVLGKHIAAGAIFIPNLVLWSEIGYFDYAAASKPLLHLWSLGIEAQFYLLWPIIIWLSLKCNASLLKATSIAISASLLLNLLIVQADVSAAFFSPLTRMWELLAGCLLAVVAHDKTTALDVLKRQLGSETMANHTLASVGILLLVYGMFFFNEDILFPGAWTLIPVIGTVLIILAGRNSWLNSRLLSNRLLVGIGLISFPLYLWHWPLLSFAVILEGTRPDEPVRIVLVVLAFVLAGLTYYFVERPIRFGRHPRFKTFLSIIAMTIVGASGWITYAQDGFKERVSQKEVETQLADLNFDIPESTGWYCSDLKYDSPRCHSTGPNPSVVVIGDSHALMIYSALRERFKAKGQDIGLYGGSDGCPPLLNVIIQDQGGDPRKCLQKGTLAIERIVADPAIHEVIVTSRGPMYTTGKGFGDIELDQFGSWILHLNGEEPKVRDNASVFSIGLSQTLDALLAAGKKVTFLHDVPELGFDIRRCSSFRPISLVGKNADACSVSRAVFEERTLSFRIMVDNVLAQRPDVKVIDLAEALCDRDRCYGSKDGVLFYIDDDHLSHRGSAFVVRRLWDNF